MNIETLIYRLDNGEELIWAAQSETFNPSSVNRTVKEIADAVRKQLRRDGLIE